MFKKIALILFSMMLLFYFIATYKPKNPTKTIFWTLQLSSFDEYFNSILKNFNNIKWIDIPYAEGEKRILASILTDNPPDLINTTTDFTMLLAKKNALLEIPKENLQNYNLIDPLMYESKYFGIPFYATSAVTLFNKSLLPDLKELPKTFDELLTIKPPENTYITMLALTENDTLLKILNKYDINSSKTINSQKSINFFTLLKNAYDNKYIPKECITQSHRDALEKYMSGKLVFLVTGANFINMIKENAPSVYENTIVLPQITGSNGKYDFSLMNFIIPLKSKYKDNALNFAMFLTNEQNQIAFSKLTSVLPVNKNSLNDDYFKYPKNKDLIAQARIISAAQLENALPPLENKKIAKDLNALSSNLIQEILINNANIKLSLDKFSEDWQKIED